MIEERTRSRVVNRPIIITGGGEGRQPLFFPYPVGGYEYLVVNLLMMMFMIQLFPVRKQFHFFRVTERTVAWATEDQFFLCDPLFRPNALALHR